MLKKSVVTALVTLGVGCSGAGDAPGLEVANTLSSPLVVEGPLASTDAETNWRFVGIKQDPLATCPKPVSGSFTTRQLFGPSLALATIPPALRAYCLYETPTPSSVGSAVVPAELAVLVNPAQLEAVEPDLAVIAPHASLGDIFGPELVDYLDHNAGRIEELPEGAESKAVIALLDTMPTQDLEFSAEPEPGVSPHGYGLWQIMKRLVCDHQRCVPLSRSQLAMGLNKTASGIEPNVLGGSFGTVSSTGEALFDAVYEGPESALVINLSLGWDPAYGDGP
ncbi:MAG: hypothetical protein AAFQ82_04035, partial [Myxococcota bacterium]